jgi:hypothetical protein
MGKKLATGSIFMQKPTSHCSFLGYDMVQSAEYKGSYVPPKH